jgi:hypothetical protein
MDEEEINIRGPPLRPMHRSPLSAPVKKKNRNRRSNTSLMAGTSPSGSRAIPHETEPMMSIVEEDMPKPSIADPQPPATTLPTPSNVNRWISYPPSTHPLTDTGVRDYIQDLHVAETIRQEGTQPKVPLCPFFLAHLLPSNRIIPFMPLFIPTCPTYQFHLLYVIKETVTSPNGEYISWVAVFLLISLEQPTQPSLVGATVSQSFLTRVESNIERERDHLRSYLREI